MTQREICEWIVRDGDCVGIDCCGCVGVNRGTACPMLDKKCRGNVVMMAQAWLDAHKEDV